MSNTLWDRVRSEIVGGDVAIETPFGRRRCVYADHTASGRAVGLIDRYVERMLELYANTHTEDDATGQTTTQRFHRAERTIKRVVGADDSYRLILTGTGATGAICRLQQILGVYVPPATRRRLRDPQPIEPRPVVFVGPFEHHSNLLSWRESLAEVVEIGLDEEGLFDLADLERKLAMDEYASRPMIGAFSAASNVTGIRAPVREIARMLHAHGARAVFDFAAAAPYTRIDVSGSGSDDWFDAVSFSPHKFIGGPGTSGVLVFRRDLYDCAMPPTFAGGGTVEFVGPDRYAFTSDIEAREQAGTPGIVQALRTALTLELTERLGYEEIHTRERELTRSAMTRFSGVAGLEVAGNPDPEKRLAIVSFTARHGEKYLHPRFVTTLLNDLFGVQSRAGCLCAGPYGHRVLGIDIDMSHRLHDAILTTGLSGVRPGWTRVNFHYLLSDAEFAYICDAIEFVATRGAFFLPLYRFDLHSGSWVHKEHFPVQVSFGIDDALVEGSAESPFRETTPAFADVLRHAQKLADSLERAFCESNVASTRPDLIPFAYATEEVG